MKIYCIMLDTMPLTKKIVDIADSKKLDLLRQVGGCCTLNSVLQMFTGTLPSDLEKFGVGNLSWRNYEDPSSGVIQWPWKHRLITQTLIDNGWKIKLHNSRYIHHMFLADDKNIECSTAHPGGRPGEEEATGWDSASSAMFERCKDSETYYRKEFDSIRNMQADPAETDTLHFVTYHQVHNAIANGKDKSLAIGLLETILDQWNLDEPNTLFWIFSDHGDWRFIGEHPNPEDYLSWVMFKDNTLPASPVCSRIISINDFYRTMLEKLYYRDANITYSESIYLAQNQDRIYFVEDGRERFDKMCSTSAVACKFSDWEDGYPRSLIQISYHHLSGQFLCKKNFFENNLLLTEHQEILPLAPEILVHLRDRFSWIP